MGFEGNWGWTSTEQKDGDEDIHKSYKDGFTQKPRARARACG